MRWASAHMAPHLPPWLIATTQMTKGRSLIFERIRNQSAVRDEYLPTSLHSPCRNRGAPIGMGEK